MKHLLISILAGLALFSYIETTTTPQSTEEVSHMQAAQNMCINSRALLTANEPTTRAVAMPMSISNDVKVGLLFHTGDDLSSARLKRTLDKRLNLGSNFNTIYSSNSHETQKNMFDKMIAENYNVIILEINAESNVQYFIEQAASKNIGLIFIGNEPDKNLLQSYDKAYYLGYNNTSFKDAIAKEIFTLFTDKLEDLDIIQEDETIKYATVLSNEKSENFADELVDSLDELGINVDNPINTQVKKYDYDLFKEIDQTIIKKCEVLIFDNSVELKRTLDYFNNPDEFKKLPKQKIVILQYDDNTEEFMKNESVLMALGFDDAQLAETTAKLAMALAMNVQPTSDVIGLEPVDNKLFYIDYSVAKN